MKKYINRVGGGYRETVDEMDIKKPSDRKALNSLLAEYSLSDTAGRYYISCRACSNWK